MYLRVLVARIGRLWRNVFVGSVGGFLNVRFLHLFCHNHWCMCLYLLFLYLLCHRTVLFRPGRHVLGAFRRFPFGLYLLMHQ